MSRARRPAEHEPRWYKCLGCRALFCVGAKTSMLTKGYKVKFCPFCGADWTKIERWILESPDAPEEWG